MTRTPDPRPPEYYHDEADSTRCYIDDERGKATGLGPDDEAERAREWRAPGNNHTDAETAMSSQRSRRP